MNGYSKFRENSDSHTVQTSPPPQTLKECDHQDRKNNPCHNCKPDIIIPPRDEPNTMMRNESFAFRRNHSTTSQRFAHNNSDLKNMMRRAFSTRKTYWRLEDDGGIEDFSHADQFVQEQDNLDKNHHDQARGNNKNVEGKKKKKAFKRLKKIFHF